MQFVRGERKEIDAQSFDINFEFAGSLNGVRVKKNAFASANGRDFFNGKEDPGFIICPHHRYNGGIWPDRFIQKVKIERAVRLDRQVSHFITLLLQELAEV